MALEIAMDEMAEKLGLDPIEFRILNDTQVDPENPERPFSQRHLVECLRMGAERFGWSKRNAQPGKVRDGRWLVGMGVAAAFRNNPVMKSAARVRLDNHGIVTVETDMTDIGTGSYTIIAQTAAEMMGVPLDKVVVRLGDFGFSGFGRLRRPMGREQFHLRRLCCLCQAARGRGAEARLQRRRRCVRRWPGALGQSQRAARRRPRALASIVAEDAIEFGDFAQEVSARRPLARTSSKSASMRQRAKIRVRRMLAVCAAGRILNPKSARSQVIGAMTMGVGAALMEELAVDKRPASSSTMTSPATKCRSMPTFRTRM